MQYKCLLSLDYNINSKHKKEVMNRISAPDQLIISARQYQYSLITHSIEDGDCNVQCHH